MAINNVLRGGVERWGGDPEGGREEFEQKKKAVRAIKRKRERGGGRPSRRGTPSGWAVYS
eukprot:scaffold85392_cov30-Tisochrysis_lutea.AAC.2